jgi:hypothetical protein
MIATIMRPPPPAPRFVVPTTQDIALVICGGGDPFAEFAEAKAMCERLGKKYVVFAGNDMIEHFPDKIDHAITLHPDKLYLWQGARRNRGFEMPERVWAHRSFNNVTNWTRDWQGSTGLFAAKVARENGHTHVVLCGVHMTVEAEHFVRKQRWNAAHGFRRGWTMHLHEIRPYVRSLGGWTREQLGPPTDEWLLSEISDVHVARTAIGLKA